MKTLRELGSLKNRVALITGGAGYLGRAFANTLAELGASIAIADRKEEEFGAISRKIRDTWHVECECIKVDLADGQEMFELPQKVADALGSLDILINNAAFVGTDKLKGWCVPFEEQSAEAWRAATEVNLTAPFFLSQASVPFLKKSGRGSIINIASIYAFMGPDMRIYAHTDMGNPAAYAASKGGLIQITRWLATVLAPHVRVNCVSPGGIFRNQPRPFLDAYVYRTPLGRMAREEDMKGVIAFLASDLSSYVTGQHIAVDGGWSAW